MHGAGIAFKVTYNDGGAKSDGGVGYRGICSDATMLLNVRTRKMTNCSDGTPCARYVARGLKPKHRPREPITDTWCYEARLLRTNRWKFGAGVYHRGPRKGQPIPMSRGGRGNIVFLTTKFPGQDEANRSVFAVYRAREKVSRDDGEELVSDGTMDLLLPDELARNIRYWDYAAPTSNGPDWRTGLFRYIDAERTERLLAEVAYLLEDRDERNVLLRALPSLRPRPPQRRTLGHPQGPGGEGKDHRALKERVAANPQLVGLPRTAKAHIEYCFPSGDRVDIAFEVGNGRWAVVEVETLFAEPGAYQAIKYRALMEARLRVPLGSGRVEAVLVAYGFDESTRKLAARYDVRLAALPPQARSRR